MIQFYLVEVMPQAESQDPSLKVELNFLGTKLKTLWIQLRRCVSRPPRSPTPKGTTVRQGGILSQRNEGEARRVGNGWRPTNRDATITSPPSRSMVPKDSLVCLFSPLLFLVAAAPHSTASSLARTRARR